MATKAKATVPVPKVVLTRAALKTYLEANLKKKFKTEDDESCLIARFVKEQLPKGWSVIVYDWIVIRRKVDGEYETVKTLNPPKWVKQFIERFDGFKDVPTTLTGAQILKENFF